MLSLELRLLGRIEVRAGGKTIALPGRKERALLTFLAMRAGRPHWRSELASLLWSTSDERQARDSLRQAILRLRKPFAPSHALPLVADRETLMFVGDAATVDVQEFERLAREETPSAIAAASALYRGDLAEGLDGLDQAFDEWLLNERQRLHDLARQVLSKLLDTHLRAGEHASAAAVARRLTARDPIDESAHRALMRIYFEQGQHALAVKQFERCREALRREIGEEPEAETERLYRDIRQHRFTTRRPSVQTAPYSPPRGQPQPLGFAIVVPVTAFTGARPRVRDVSIAERPMNFKCWALMSQAWREILSHMVKLYLPPTKSVI
jgi:DNA-binding SARP family transcriptional activator